MKFIVISALTVLSLGLSGCALPTVSEDLEKMIGKRFTNPPRPEKRWVTVKDKDGKEMTVLHHSYYSIVGNRYKQIGNRDEIIYYKKESDGINERYYIHWIPSGLCSYSLLVSPDDMILSWRNEGPKHVSRCQHN